MESVNFELKDGCAILYLNGHIDSNNAKATEDKINELLNCEYQSVVIDADDLEYISSAGLRIILRLKKANPSLKIINASSEVYEVFDMTGFTEMIPIEKAYKKVSVEGCEVIGEGANGKVYRINEDTIVKTYKNPDSINEILNERELAKKAFVLGIPTAISYDIVRVGEGYGTVFEELRAKSLLKLCQENPDKVDEYVKISVDLLKIIHETVVKPGEMPEMKPTVLKWVNRLEGHLPENTLNKLTQLIEATDCNYNVIHGDYHFKNVMVQDGEALLIDMDTVCTGHPVFEFGSIFNAYIGFGCVDKTVIEKFLGLSVELTNHIWKKTLELYFNTSDEVYLQAIEDMAKLIGYTRLAQRAIRRDGDPQFIDYCKNQIIELTEKLDTLEF